MPERFGKWYTPLTIACDLPSNNAFNEEDDKAEAVARMLGHTPRNANGNPGVSGAKAAGRTKPAVHEQSVLAELLHGNSQRLNKEVSIMKKEDEGKTPDTVIAEEGHPQEDDPVSFAGSKPPARSYDGSPPVWITKALQSAADHTAAPAAGLYSGFSPHATVARQTSIERGVL
ncbi:hypothetical protein ACFL5Q_02230 [Planctomycetota bacterium]